MKLKDKVILITGGARVGVVVAEALSREGAKLILSYRKSKKIAEETAKKTGGVTFCADGGKEKDVKKLFSFIKKKFGRLDGLIAMASTFPKTPYQTLNEKIWDREIANNLKTAFLCAKAAGDLMLKQKNGGKIIFIGDAKVENPYPGRLPYLIGKAGVHMLTKILAKELAPKIIVNCVAPGPILPQKNISKKEYKKAGRWGTPEDAAKAILSLLKSDSMTGKILRVAA